jgi:hypothetical protein
MRYVKRTSRKYAFDKPTLLILWLVQEKIDLTQIEVLALKEASFFLLEKPRCPFVNLVVDDKYAPMNNLLHVPLGIYLAMVVLPLSISHWI